MQFRYREMIYRPDFYIFHNDDQEEWFPNGIFNYNVSRMIRDLEAYEKDSAGVSWLYAAVRISVSVEEVFNYYHDMGELEEEHIQAADLNRPLIFVELAPDCFNLVDGHHRLEKARREGLSELPAWTVGSHTAVHYLGSEYEYSKYTGYWNCKIEDIRDQKTYKGVFCPCPAPIMERDLIGHHIWNRMGMCLNECQRVEIYSEDQWFTLFRLNGKLFCGESEGHEPSIRCQTPFQIKPEMIETAAEQFEKWQGEEMQGNTVREIRKEIRRSIRHADVLMACVRVFSEY